MSKRRTGHLRRIVAGVTLAVAASSPARPIASLSDSTHDLTSGVYVRDSAVAVEQFALAQRMERLKEWGKAADVYQEMLQGQADKVVASRVEKDRITQYESVIAAVQERLCAWPTEGLDIYRGRFESEASVLLEAAKGENRPDGMDDPAGLHRVFANYFVTDAGKAAGIRLLDLHLENGDFAAAVWTGQHLLDAHPLLLDDHAGVLFRTALADHFIGNDPAAKAMLTELRNKFPAALGKVRGVDAVLADTLADALNQPVEAPAVAGGENWPMPFGSADRSRVPKTSGGGGARMFTIDITDALPKGANLAGPIKQQFRQDADRARKQGLMTGIMPVVDNGELFFHDNTRVYAVSLESGLPLPGWQQTYGGDRNGRYTITGWVTPRSQQDTLCVTDDFVLGVLGQPDASGVALTNIGRNDTRLTCLDRHTGRLVWEASPSRFPAEPTALRQLDLSGSPLVVGNNVYIIGRGGRGLQFEDCYVVCLDLATGNFKWARYLASANSTAQFDMDVVADGGANLSHIAFSGGRLYICTNVGAVAAIDAYDGSVIWLNLYPRETDNRAMLGMPQRWGGAAIGNPDGDKPWTYNPVIVKDGKVFVLPTDGKFVHVYDAGDGTEIKRIKMTGLGPNGQETADTLVGVGGANWSEHGGSLVVASDRSVFNIDWPNYDPERGINNLNWYKSFSKTQFANDSIRGRPFMTADSVFVPLAWAMSSLSLRNGATQYTYPAAGTWDPKDEDPGNVLVTQDHLIVAGPQKISVYTDLNVATRKLDEAIGAAPNDPQPRLRYAEILFVASRTADAIAKLDEAAALIRAAAPAIAPTTADTSQPTGPLLGTLSAINEPASGSPRARLFFDALTFAEKLSALNTDDSSRSADLLFDKASAAAATPAELVTYRLRRAEFAHQKIRTADELALYQSILADPRLRSVTVSNAENTASPAGSVARLAVADLIQRAGPGVYQPYEQQAQQELASIDALTADDKPQRLVALAEAYPNSSTARAALLDAADAYESAGNPRASASLLRQFYSRYSDSPERARAIESLARAYLEMPNRADGLNVAIGRLEQGAKLSAQARLTRPLKLPDGTIIEHKTFTEAADALRKFQSQVATGALPDPHIPTTRLPGKYINSQLLEDAQAAVDNVQALIPPLHDWARHDRVVAYSTSGGLDVYAVGSNKPLFHSAAIDEPPKNVAWIGQALLVWCPSRLVLLRTEPTPSNGTTTAPSGAAGEVMWDAPVRTLPVSQIASIGGGDDEASAPGGDDAGDLVDQVVGGQQQQQIVLPGGQRVIIRGGGRVIIGRGGQLRIIGGNGINIIRGPGVGLPGGPVIGPAQPANTNGTEQIDRLVPGADRIVFSTNNGPGLGGRVVSLSVSDGKVQWQTRSEDHAIDQLAANDDFVVIRASDESDVRLAAFDALTGQPVWRPKAFSRDNNDAAVPVNFALAEDGSLVYLLPDHVCCKDLFDPDVKLRFDRPIPHNNGVNPTNTFLGAAAPDQLLIADGRVLVVSDNGTFVRLYSALDGRPYRISPESEGLLGTENTNDPWNTHMRLVGNNLYVFGKEKVIHYNLNNADDTAGMSGGTIAQTTVTMRDVITTRDYLMTIASAVPGDQPPPPGQDPRSILIQAYSRAVFDGRESSIAVLSPRRINEPSGITQLQVVDGGVYYCTGDHRLHMLLGS